MKDGWIGEQMIAEMLGVSLPRVKEIRPDLERGTDWDVENGRVIYSQTGVEQIVLALGMPAPESGAPGAENPPAEPEPPADAGQAATEPPGVAGAVAEGGKEDDREKTAPKTVGVKLRVIGPAPNPRWLFGCPVTGEKRKVAVRMMGRRLRKVRKGAILVATVGKDGVLEFAPGGAR